MAKGGNEMLLAKENARPTDQSRARETKNKASVPRQMTEREGLALVAMFVAMFAWMLLDMVVGA